MRGSTAVLQERSRFECFNVVYTTVSLILLHTTFVTPYIAKRSQVGVHSARSSIFKCNQSNINEGVFFL